MVPASGGNVDRYFWGIGSVACCYRVVRRHVLRSVTKLAGDGTPAGARGERIGSAAAGAVARLGIDGWRCVSGGGRGTGIDAADWGPSIQGQSTRSARLWVGVRGDDGGVVGCVF